MTIGVLYFLMVIRECDSCCDGGHVAVLGTVTPCDSCCGGLHVAVLDTVALCKVV